METMNLIKSLLLSSLVTIVLRYSNAAPVPTGSGQELTIRLEHLESGRFVAVENGEVTLSSDETDPAIRFRQTAPSPGYVRLQSVAYPGEYLLLNETIEGVNTTSYTLTIGVPEDDNDEGSGSGAPSTQAHSDWMKVEVTDDIFQLKVTNQNDNECYLAANFDGKFSSNPCDASHAEFDSYFSISIISGEIESH